MRRATVAIVAAVAWCAAAPAAGGSSVVGVTGTEFDLALSRTKVDPGLGVVEFRNSGEDPHDLVLRRVGSTRRHQVPETLPGDVAADLELRFRRDSRYVMWCSTLAGQHRAQGMEATLRVRRR